MLFDTSWPGPGHRQWRFALLLIAVFLALLALRPSLAADRPRLVAAATEAAPATDAALAQLRAGGNAVDAAVTAALVGGVVNATSSGIGGGGFALVFDANSGRVTVIDFRERAPAGLEPPAFERRPFEAAERGRAVGVPGEVAGLFELHRRFGRRDWLAVVEPAARVARRGFAVGRHVGRLVAAMGDQLKVEPRLLRQFWAGGRPLRSGRWLKNPSLALTLERIRDFGPQAFYDGPIAVDIANHVRQHGGSMTLEDLRRYRPIERAPIRVSWEGYDVYTMPPPSAGGLMLAQVLKLFSRDELSQHAPGSGALTHLLAEAMRGSLADRARFIGDPAFVPDRLPVLLGDPWLKRRKATLSADQTRTRAEFAQSEHGTHHLVTADAEGNVVSLTTTVNSAFGAKIVTRAGIVLNNELDDFTAQSWVSDLGIAESPNRARPKARPVSSMTPTIVLREGQPVLALGGSGGMAIAPNVTQTTLLNLAFGEPPPQALSRWRFSLPTRDATIRLPRPLSTALVRDLEARGEKVSWLRLDQTAVQMVQLQPRVSAAADPRKFGKASVRAAPAR